MVPTSMLPPRARSIFLLFALGLVVSGCTKNDGAASARGPGAGGGGRRGGGGVPPVLVGKVHRKSMPLMLEAIGAVEPIRTAALRSQVTGMVMKIHFNEGQDVKAGDLLFEIDPRPFQNAVRSTEADLQNLRIQLDTAQAQVARYHTLNEQALVSKEQFQAINDTARSLEAKILASEAAASNARLQLDYCSIRAPLSGRTGNVGAHEGDLVRASDAAVSLVTIHQLDPIYVTFGVPQQNLVSLARYRAEGPISVSAAPSGTDGATEKGELTFIDNAVEPTTGTIKIKATFSNEAHRLWPGQFSSVRVTLASPEMLTVPTSAVQNDQKGQHVFVVTEAQIAELRDVVSDRSYGGDTAILKGLAEGETVITDGQLRVLPGKPVEVKSPSGATGAGGDGPRGKGKGKGKPSMPGTPAS